MCKICISFYSPDEAVFLNACSVLLIAALLLSTVPVIIYHIDEHKKLPFWVYRIGLFSVTIASKYLNHLTIVVKWHAMQYIIRLPSSIKMSTRYPITTH